MNSSNAAQYVASLQETLSIPEDQIINIETLYAFERNALLAMIHFRRQYNAHLPPNRLPSEILGAIFQLLRFPGTTSTADLTGPLYHYTDVISALRVCHRWYRVATATATLWTFIDFAHDSNAVAKLRRTQKALLHIRFSLDQFVSHVLVDLLRFHGSRVRELHLWAGDHASLTKLPGRLNVLADRLEQLVVAGTQRGGTVTLRSLFLGYTPVLKALVLQRVPWVPSNSFPALTHLYLSRLPRFPIVIFLDLLRHTPQLQLLHVDECEYDIYGFDGNRTAVVSLPHMRRLSLGHLSFDPIQHILSHLVLPDNVMLRLYALRFWQEDDADFEDFVLPNPFTVSNPFTRLEIVTGENWRKFVVEGDGPSSGGLWVEFLLHVVPSLSSEDWEEWLLKAPQMVSLSNIETVHLSLRFWDILADLAPRMPRVKTLVVEEQARPTNCSRHHTAVDCVVNALREEEPVCFPNLETLVLDACCELPDPGLILSAVQKRDRYKRRLRFLKIRVDPSQYTTDYITEQYTEVCKHVDEVLFVSDEVRTWEVNEVWRADHNYWVLRRSEDPMLATEYSCGVPMREDS